MKKVLFTVVVLVLVAAFGVSAFMVGNYLIDGKKQANRYDELSDIAASAQNRPQAETEKSKESQDPTAETTEPTEPGMLPGTRKSMR